MGSRISQVDMTGNKKQCEHSQNMITYPVVVLGESEAKFVVENTTNANHVGFILDKETLLVRLLCAPDCPGLPRTTPDCPGQTIPDYPGLPLTTPDYPELPRTDYP
ncbi:hypothetical protein RRG08_030082 [Elysia crispata]|uniref:Uncharacterized protein n=1 Tax=Elysia crispata TaxID=231223 RepID=A0AAE1DLA8_9GAST|nr:hypothetical protein RRG08_030082 [Elysia crispata]